MKYLRIVKVMEKSVALAFSIPVTNKSRYKLSYVLSTKRPS